MSCIISFDDNPTDGILDGNPSTSGVFDLVGYSTNPAGPFGAGGNYPNTTQNWGDQVDSSSLETGFYQFKYRANLPDTDPCYGEILVVVAVIQGTTDVGANVAISLCSEDAARNILQDANLYALDSLHPVAATISGSGVSSAGYLDQGTADLFDDTYDPVLEPAYPVTRVFEITYNPQAPTGFDESGCTNCNTRTVTVTYTVTEAFQTGTAATVAVCNDGDI